MKILKRLGATLALILAMSLALPSAAMADPLVQVAVAATVSSITFSLPPVVVIGLVLTVLLPAVTGWVTNSSWSSKAKTIFHAAVSALGGLLAELADSLTTGSAYDIGIGLLTAIGVFAAGVFTYRQFYKAEDSTGTSVAERWASNGGITLHGKHSAR